MSKKPVEKTGRVAITLEDLLVRAEQLKQYLAQLEARINDLTTQITELQLAKNTLENLPEEGGEALVITDRLSTLFIPAIIPKDWSRRVIVRIGLNYYIKTSSEKASETIVKSLNSLRQILQSTQQQYRAVLTEYNAIQQILAKIYAQAQQKQVGGATPTPSGG